MTAEPAAAPAAPAPDVPAPDVPAPALPAEDAPARPALIALGGAAAACDGDACALPPFS